jgi:polysulfide reductase chain C
MNLPEIRVDPVIQKEWGWPIALAVFLGGLGGGLFLLCEFVLIRIGMVLGILSMCLSVIFLVLDLGKRARLWRVFSNPRTSWLSRGAIFLTGAIVFGIWYVAPLYIVGFPMQAGTALRPILGLTAGFFAFLVILYTGFLLSASRFIPTWNTLLLPIQFTIYAFLGGVDVIFILNALGWIRIEVEIFAPIAAALLIATLVLLGIYLAIMFFARIGAQEGANLLIKGSLCPLFIGGVLGVGLIIPIVIDLLIIIFFPNAAAFIPVTLLGISAALTLIGSFLYRFTLLKAGVYHPRI